MVAPDDAGGADFPVDRVRRHGRRCQVRRFRFALIAGSISLLAVVAPVSADTSPNGTNFFSSASSCTTSGSRVVCTDTALMVFSNEDGSDGPPCLEVNQYSIGSNGRSQGISYEFGCALGGTITIGADFSVALDPTQVTLERCGRRTCTETRTVTVSANDSPIGPISTTTSRSTTKDGSCTTRTTTTDQFVELAGTMTIDGAVVDQTGSLDVFTSTSTTHCK
jgi:hypothetical protein